MFLNLSFRSGWDSRQSLWLYRDNGSSHWLVLRKRAKASCTIWYVQVPLAASIIFIHFQSVPPLSDWVALAIICTALLHQEDCVDEWTGLPAIQKNHVVWQCGIFQWKNGTSNVVCTCFNWLKVRLVLEASSCTHSDSQQVGDLASLCTFTIHWREHHPNPCPCLSKPAYPAVLQQFWWEFVTRTSIKVSNFRKLLLRFTLCNIPGASWQCPKKETCLEVEDFRV